MRKKNKVAMFFLLLLFVLLFVFFYVSKCILTSKPFFQHKSQLYDSLNDILNKQKNMHHFLDETHWLKMSL